MLTLDEGLYKERVFAEIEVIDSKIFPELRLIVGQVLALGVVG